MWTFLLAWTAVVGLIAILNRTHGFIDRLNPKRFHSGPAKAAACGAVILLAAVYYPWFAVLWLFGAYWLWLGL